MIGIFLASRLQMEAYLLVTQAFSVKAACSISATRIYRADSFQGRYAISLRPSVTSSQYPPTASAEDRVEAGFEEACGNFISLSVLFGTIR